MKKIQRSRARANAPTRVVINRTGQKVLLGLTAKETEEFERIGDGIVDGRDDRGHDRRWFKLYAKHERRWKIRASDDVVDA